MRHGCNLSDFTAPKLARYLAVYRAAYRALPPDMRHDAETWYERAHTEVRELADALGLPVETVAAMTSALSPGLRWEENLAAVAAVHALGAKCRVSTSRNVEKARLILLGEYWPDVISADTAPKTHAFTRLLIDPSAPYAAIDRWMLRAVGLPESIKAHCYDILMHGILNAARQMGVHAGTFQAVVWTTARDYYRLKPGEYLEVTDGRLVVAGAPRSERWRMSRSQPIDWTGESEHASERWLALALEAS